MKPTTEILARISQNSLANKEEVFTKLYRYLLRPDIYFVAYITKPFVIGALQRKIKAMFAMLEHHKPAKDIYDDGRLFLDFSEQAATLNGKPLALSPMEYKMLNLFRKNPKQVLTRQQLLEKLWDAEERFVDEHTLTTSISRIRSKIETDGGAPYIKTIYGMGYQWMGGEAK